MTDATLMPGHAPLKDHPLANLFPLLPDKELAELADDIAANGQAETVKLHRGMILDGRNRYRACALKNLPVRTEIFEGTDRAALSWVISKNLRRRHLTESQRAVVAAKITTLRLGDNQHRGSTNSDTLSFIEPTEPPVSAAAAADLMNVGRTAVFDAKKVQEKGSSELQEAVEQGDVAVSAAAKIAERPIDEQKALLDALPRDEAGKLTPDAKKQIRKVAKEVRAEDATEKKRKRAEKEAKLGAKQRALPDEKFGVIVADPEWHDEVWSDETGMDRHAANHYPTSAETVIASRNVASIAADDCVLWLWVTNQHLAIGLDVMKGWGFAYKSNYCWGKDHISLGRWQRGKHELLLIGTKGSPPCPAPGTQWESLILVPKGEHSAKPECFLDMIEEYFPTLPKIELNRRGPARPGWKAWGNESADAPERPALLEHAEAAE